VISPSSGAKAPAFSIVIHEKGGAERREVFESAEISVGRVQGNDIVLPKGNVSKRHARLLYRDGRFIVTDLNSTNGTYVNRRRIAQATIVRDGDKIYVGDFVLRIEQPGESASAGEGANGEALEGPRSTSRTDSKPRTESKPPSVPSEQGTRATMDSISDESSGRPTAHSFDVQTPSAATRSSPDADTVEPTDLREVLGILIARAAERIGARDLKRPVEPAQEQSVDQVLRELWKPLEREAGTLDVERVMARARAELLELGPLSEPLRDSAVVEIGVPRYDRVVLGRSGRPNAVLPGFSSELSLGWTLHRLCEEAGAPLRSDEVNVERRLPSGALLQAFLGTGPNQGTVLVIRRPRRTTLTLEELVRRGTISRAIATFLQHCISARLNILVVGSRDGGPETMLGALAMTQVEGTPVWISEAGSPPFAAMPRVDAGLPPERLAHAVELAGRIPGARLIADLSRAPLVSAVVAAIGDGADGVVAARAGAGVGRALARLTAELSMLGPATNPLSARELVASCFDVAVEIAQLRDGRYRVLRVAELTGTSPDGFQLSDIFSFVADRTAAGGVIEGTFSPTGTPPRLVETLRARGIQIDTALFSRPLPR
jgi:pilus assembly protein CpaF